MEKLGTADLCGRPTLRGFRTVGATAPAITTTRPSRNGWSFFLPFDYLSVCNKLYISKDSNEGRAGQNSGCDRIDTILNSYLNALLCHATGECQLYYFPQGL